MGYVQLVQLFLILIISLIFSSGVKFPSKELKGPYMVLSINFFFSIIVMSFSFSLSLFLSLSSSYLFFDFSNFVMIKTRDDIEDEQYLFEGVKLTEAEYRELR